MKTDSIHVLSLGAGVQSSAMALMFALGELKPMPAAAIFADTKAEPQSVYKWLDWLEKQLPFPVRRCNWRDLEERAGTLRKTKSGKQYVVGGVPYFLRHADGEKGMMQRRCTSSYKIEPIQRELRRMLNRRAIRRTETGLVVQYIGISRDEAHRMKPALMPWIENRYPLVDGNITRRDCLRWAVNRI